MANEENRDNMFFLEAVNISLNKIDRYIDIDLKEKFTQDEGRK